MTSDQNIRVKLLETAITIPYAEIARFCEQHHVAKMWLYGSVLRDDFTSDSDIDVLVEFAPDHVPGWKFYSTWTHELSDIWGHAVDLCTPDLAQQIHPQKCDALGAVDI